MFTIEKTQNDVAIIKYDGKFVSSAPTMMDAEFITEWANEYFKPIIQGIADTFLLQQENNEATIEELQKKVDYLDDEVLKAKENYKRVCDDNISQDHEISDLISELGWWKSRCDIVMDALNNKSDSPYWDNRGGRNKNDYDECEENEYEQIKKRDRWL